MTTFGLQREKIPASIDKRSLAQAIAVAVKALVASIETRKNDFWINVELNIHIEHGSALEKHASVNVYIASDVRKRVKGTTGKVVSPEPIHRIRIQAKLNEMTIARVMAYVVKTVLTAVQAEQDDFWVNIDLNVHIKRGQAYEKKARVNVYGDLIDPCGTTVVESVNSNEVPPEVLQDFCEDFEKREK